MDNNIELKLHTDISNTDISNHDKFIVINIPNENIEITQDNYNNFNNDNSLELNSTTRPTRNFVDLSHFDNNSINSINSN